MRAIWTDPYLRRVLRGKLEKAEQLITASLAAELGLPADDSGPRVFAGAITGLFITMAEKAVEHPDSFDPLVECARGLLFLRAGLDALKRDAAAASHRVTHFAHQGRPGGAGECLAVSRLPGLERDLRHAARAFAGDRKAGRHACGA